MNPARSSRIDISALHQLVVITRLTLREAQSRRLLRFGVVLGIAFVALFNLSYFVIVQDLRSDSPAFLQQGLNQFLFNTFLLTGLYVVNFLVIMVTVLTTVGTLSDEVDTNTVHSIVAKPIRRWQIVLGKWIGHALMLTAYSLMMSGGLIGGVWLIGGYVIPNALTAIAILALEALVTLSLTLFGSSLMSTLANGIAVFMLYGVAFVGGWIEQIGALFGSETAMNIGTTASYIMPSEALWRYTAGVMQLHNPTGAGFTPFTMATQPTEAIVTYALIYVLVGVIGAVWVFSRRDF